jgi:hypothetical protein
MTDFSTLEHAGQILLEASRERLAAAASKALEMRASLPTRPHVVYRFFDENDRLLYVGCTVDLKQRCGMHRGMPWFRKIARATTTSFPNREEALQAEARAIRDEYPAENTQHRVAPNLSAKIPQLTLNQLRNYIAATGISGDEFLASAIVEKLSADTACFGGAS